MGELWAETVNWLNTNSASVTALSTTILVIVTIVYVYQAHRLVRETKALREMAVQPSLLS